MNTKKMKVVVCTKYGSPDVLQLKEVERPIPKDKEMLVKIKVSIVTAADSMMRKGVPYIGRLFMGLTKPKYPVTGTGFAGEVVALGKAVKRFEIGDEVFGESVFGAGTNAEYLLIQEDGVIAKKPQNMTFEAVAPTSDGPLTSLNLLRDKAKIKEGQSILIIGASGSLGTAGVQLAKHFGAKVTGVCSTSNLEMVKMLGADKVIDYTVVDFTKEAETYDIIYDTVGKSSFSKCKHVLSKHGIYLSPVLDFSSLFHMMTISVFSNKKVIFDATGMRPVPELRSLLHELKELMELGKLKSVIDRRYPLEQIVEAHEYVDTGHKKGNLVIKFD